MLINMIFRLFGWCDLSKVCSEEIDSRLCDIIDRIVDPESEQTEYNHVL